jgi:cephalosporin hydroxylase
MMNQERFEQIFNEELGGMSARIAQDPAELCQVVERLNVLRPSRTLEIGVQYGGTTRFWQLLTAGSVVAVDMDTSQVVVDFSDHAPPLFIQGDSTNPETIAKVRELAPYDFLWIDGGHTHEIARSDWDNYSPMVRPGGLVGIHDVKAEREGPYLLVKELKEAGLRCETFINQKGTALVTIPE